MLDLSIVVDATTTAKLRLGVLVVTSSPLLDDELLFDVCITVVDVDWSEELALAVSLTDICEETEVGGVVVLMLWVTTTLLVVELELDGRLLNVGIVDGA